MSDTILNEALLRVVHPLDDTPEEKLFRPDLGRMRMTRLVRFSLIGLQVYVAAMLILLGIRAITLL